MQEANVNLSIPLHVSDIPKLFLSQVSCGNACLFFFVHSIYLYDMQNEIPFWEDGPRVLGLLLKVVVLTFPVAAPGGALWAEECMNAVS